MGHLRRADGSGFPARVIRNVTLESPGSAALSPNDFLYVPPGGIHGFRNEADELTSILMLFAPGAPREHYFEGMAKLGDMTDEERHEWFIANDNFFIE